MRKAICGIHLVFNVTRLSRKLTNNSILKTSCYVQCHVKIKTNILDDKILVVFYHFFFIIIKNL